MKYLASILHVITVAGLTALILYAIRKVGARRRPAELGPERGRISPGKVSAWLFLAMAAGLLGLGVVALESGAVVPGALIIAFALLFAVMVVPSLTHRLDVRWDADGMTGPGRTFLGIPGWTTTHIAWRDIADTGHTANYDYVESRFGTRIHWSYLYPGHGFLEQAIATYRATPPGSQGG